MKSLAISPEEVLLAHGVPENTLYQMTELQVEHIANTINPEAIFVSYEEIPVSLNDLGISTYGTISSTDLVFSVVGFHLGNNNYLLYPNFEWKNYSKTPSNDVFAVSLYSGWELTPDKTNCCYLYNRNISGQNIGCGEYYPAIASPSGVIFHFGKNLVSSAGFEAITQVYATKKSSTATHAVVINYVHDNTNGAASYSFGISFGGASISVTNGKSYDSVAKTISIGTP